MTEIQGCDHVSLEGEHDYIQWLFPLPEPSPVNPLAPVLDQETIDLFAHTAELRNRLKRSFEVMLDFYGFELREDSATPEVRPSARFESAAKVWLSPGNHNHLRITRILRCLSLLGLGPDARAFFDALAQVYRSSRGHNAISRTSFSFWEHAVT